MKIDGKCHCGAVTYEAEVDPDGARICHCADCQTLSGTAFRTVAFARPGSFRLLTGPVKEYVKVADSGNRRIQAFCPECGTSIYATAVGDEPKVYGIRLGTTSQRRELTPKAEIWCSSALPWVAPVAEKRSEKQ